MNKVLFAFRPGLCFAALLAGAGGWTQVVGNTQDTRPESQAGQTPTIHVEVKQVLVPVTVTDSKGHSVQGLRSNNFRVFEDGVEQRIVSFSAEVGAAGQLFQSQPPTDIAGPPELISPNTSEGKTRLPIYLVVVDTLNSEFGNFEQVRRALQKLLRGERAGEALYGLVTLTRGVAVIQQLTTDPSAVLRILDDKRFTNSILASEQSNLTLQETQLLQMLDDYCQHCPCSRGARICSKGSQFDKIMFFAASAAQACGLQLHDFLAGLRTLVESLGTIPGKRTLILISDGFSIQPGRDLFELIAAYVNDPGVGLQDPVPRLDSEIQDLLRAAQSRDVAFYAIDSRGLYVIPPGGYDVTVVSRTKTYEVGPRIEEAKAISVTHRGDGLQQLAEETGGLFFHNSNDILKGLRRALEDGRAYYLLVYVPSNRRPDGKFRKILVQVDGKNLNIRAKQGYWAPVNRSR